MREQTDLLTLRAQLARAEKQARKAVPPPSPPPTAAPRPPAPKPQREAELEGIETGDFSLGRAHARLRDLVWEGRYHICPHAVAHARAEGFLEHDIMGVLVAGRVRAVYPEDNRWLVCGFFEAQGIRLPLHVVAELHHDGGQRGGGRQATLDIVTAFVPKHPHHIISRARLAVMLRWDSEKLRHHTALPANKAGLRGKGRWKRGA